jgi:hypothetical protein
MGATFCKALPHGSKSDAPPYLIRKARLLKEQP